MSLATASGKEEVGVKWKQYASGALRDLRADSPDTRSAARRIVILASGSFSVMKDAEDRNNPIGPLPSGYVHDGYVSEATCDQAFIAYW